MELANLAFHADTPGRLSVLGKHMRKINLKEKVDHLFDESKGKRSILRRYLSDAVKQLKYTEIDEFSNNSDFAEYTEAMNCTVHDARNSGSVSENLASHDICLDIGYIQDFDEISESERSSSSSDLDVDLERTPGDGTEMPDTENDNVPDSKSDRYNRVIVGSEEGNLVNHEADQIQTVGQREGKFINTDKSCTSDTTSQCAEKYFSTKHKYCACTALSDTRKRLQHKTTGKLKGLLRLYKTMKMKNKLAKKYIAGNLTCFTPVKSRTCLNSAFINDQSGIEGAVCGNTRLNLNSVNNSCIITTVIGNSGKNNQLDSLSSKTNITSNVLDAAFISSSLTDSQCINGFTDTETMQEHNTVMEISDHTGDEMNFAKLESQFFSIYQNTTNCSSTFEEFAYLNNGFVMD